MNTMINAQNVLGKINGKAALGGVVLDYFKSETEQKQNLPEKTLTFGIMNLYEMHLMNLNELNFFVHETLRFAGNKIYGSTAGSPEEEIDIQINKQSAAGSAGEAILSLKREPDMPYNVKFIMDNDNNRIQFDFTIPEPFEPKEGESIEDLQERFSHRGYYIARLTYLFDKK
jgi:hypothetical protein